MVYFGDSDPFFLKGKDQTSFPMKATYLAQIVINFCSQPCPLFIAYGRQEKLWFSYLNSTKKSGGKGRMATNQLHTPIFWEFCGSFHASSLCGSRGLESSPPSAVLRKAPGKNGNEGTQGGKSLCTSRPNLSLSFASSSMGNG